MEQLILNTADDVKHVSKRRVYLDNILQRVIKTSATNLDNETQMIFQMIDQMIIQGLIDQSYKYCMATDYI